MSRLLEIGSKRFTCIHVLDEPGQGGACHEYEVQPANGEQNPPFAKVSFQSGPIKEFGVNGCHQEDLLAIVIDRLESFQKGNFRCRENAIAITKVQEALMWLNARTQKRIDRGIEGTNVNHE